MKVRETSDAIILAGGDASPEMHQLTKQTRRGLFEFHGRSYADIVYSEMRNVDQIQRIAIVGPPELERGLSLQSNDIFVPEGSTLSDNLFKSINILRPAHHCLVTASDNPLLTATAFSDFLDRCDWSAGFSYPYLRHSDFLRAFPHATNIPVKFKDGIWIGGGCVRLNMEYLPALESGVKEVIASRKSLWRMLRLLGLSVPVLYASRQLTVGHIKQWCKKRIDVDADFVPDCDPAFAIDIDDPEDWHYLGTFERFKS